MSSPDRRTTGDVIGELRREYAERVGAPSPDHLPFRLEGEAGYTDCDASPFHARCGGCDRCLFLQCEHYVDGVGR